MKAIYEKKLSHNFAQQNGISVVEIDKKAQEIFDSLPEVDSVTKEKMSEDARWGRAYRKVRRAFNKKVKEMANSMDGMIVCRMTNRDFDRNQYNYAMRTLITEGKDAAISKGLINDDEQPLYQWGDKKGQIILNENQEPGRPSVIGRAIGYTFKQNDNGEYESIEPRYFFIGKDKADTNVPICQIGKLGVNVANKKQDGFFSDNHFLFYNNALLDAERTAPYNVNDIQEILGQWNQAFGDNFTVVSNKNDLSTFKDEHTYSKDNKKAEYDFCVIPGNVMGIVIKEKWFNSEIDIEFIDYDTLESSLMSVYIPLELLQGLDIHEDDKGIFVLQSVQYGKNTNWHLGGFLHVDDDVDVEEFFGVDLSGDEDV